MTEPSTRTLSDSFLLLLAFLLTTGIGLADWAPAQGPLRTRWAAQVSPDNVHAEYPRPQMVREEWANLNGLWSYAVRPRAEESPEPPEAGAMDGEILVPFAIESALSGVMKPVGAENVLWYRRTFAASRPEAGGRLLLHFGAVDWHSTVWVNGEEVGKHQGGYDSFSFDITGALAEGTEQEIVVRVWDPTDRGYQPRGKQVTNPQGIWYTSVTGIWQTVWCEPVPAASIERLRLVADVDAGRLLVTVLGRGTAEGDQVELVARGGTRVAGRARGRIGEAIAVPIEEPRLWSPDSPFLYDLEVTLRRGDAALDRVASYFGMRKISVGKGPDGFRRLLLNDEPLFQYGPLDQGWWPDGLYTAPTDEALRFDVEVTRRLGFNMARKHVKVEPARWYYHCDQIGLLVWQDLPNGDRHIRPNEDDIVRSEESRANYFRELAALIDTHENHPSIVVWVPFNEGWGQFETDHVLRWTKERDPTRLVDGPSGWTDRGTGDIRDLHVYPGPGMPEPEEARAVVLGEFGGLGWPVPGHLWWDRRNWGYRTYGSRDELWDNYELLMRKLHPLIGKGLAAAIYTQTTDVEGEVNGLLTYDRELIKLGADRLAHAHARLFSPPPIFETRTIVATSRKETQAWRYTTEEPAGDWHAVAFDDSAWEQGPAGFGDPSTPGSVVRTAWSTPRIWLRRTFELDEGALPADARDLFFLIHHDEDARVYLNGERVLEVQGYVMDYTEYPLGEKARTLLKPGRNVVAIDCRQTRGGQYIDWGIVEIVEKKEE